MKTFQQKCEKALEKALKERDNAFQNYKQGLPQGDISFSLVLKNGRDELKDGITEFELDIFLGEKRESYTDNKQVQSKIEGIVPMLQNLGIENLKLQTIVMEKESELKASELYQELQSAKLELQTNEAQQNAIREQGKQLMLEGGLKKVVALDGTEISLKASPGSLVVSEGTQLSDQWYKVTKTLDKVRIKKAFNEGTQFPEGVYIESDYSFIVKGK